MVNPFTHQPPRRLGYLPANPATGEPRVIDMTGMEYMFPGERVCECRATVHDAGCSTPPVWLVKLSIRSPQSIGLELRTLCDECLEFVRGFYGAQCVRANPIGR